MTETAWEVPARLQVGTPLSECIGIEAPASEVWALIAAPGHLKSCHPFCAATEVARWDGQGSLDTITYYSGFTYRRHFVAWFDEVGYDIELGVAPDITARVLWRLSAENESNSSLTITVYPYLKSDLSDEKKLAYQRRLFGETLQHYLQCVVQGVRHKVLTGEDVSEDQFGRNSHYSRGQPAA